MEKDVSCQVIDHLAAATGYLRIVTEGEAKVEFSKSYVAMLADELMVGDPMPFVALMDACAELELELEVKADRARVATTR